jgi:serine protease Do
MNLKKNQSGKVLLLVVIFITGVFVGGVVIGKVVKNQVHGQASASVNEEKADKGAMVPLPALTQADRRTPVVIATQKVVPAVVSITVTQIQVVRNPVYGFDFFGGMFIPDFETKYREVQSIGSGIVIDTLGHILTNHHVVENASTIIVNLPDGRELKAEIIGIDPTTDLAVIRVRARALPLAELGSSEDLMLGETCIAMGNPFGYMMSDANPSVTTGVISALHREMVHSKQSQVIYRDMIQTDAAINPGNSGGPLVNLVGQVIGINTFIVSPSGGSIGLGFAIPISRAKKVIKELIQFGARRKYQTGLRIQDLDPNIARALDLSRDVRGVIVTDVERGSAADRAGLKRSDIIAQVNDDAIRSSEDIQFSFADFFAGDKVYLLILRGGKQLKIPLVLEIDKKQASRR